MPARPSPNQWRSVSTTLLWQPHLRLCRVPVQATQNRLLRAITKENRASVNTTPLLQQTTPPENPGLILRTALINVPVKCAPSRVLRRARRPVATPQSLPRHLAAAGGKLGSPQRRREKNSSFLRRFRTARELTPARSLSVSTPSRICPALPSNTGFLRRHFHTDR